MISVNVESLVKTYNLSPRYKSGKDIEALRSLSFSVERASMYGIIGPDGAGKTTFMRIAACLLFQTSGTVTIGGFDTLTSPARVKRIIGYMPQRFSLYQDLSVWENLIFFANLFGVPGSERRKRIDRLLDFSRLGPFVKRRAGQLSGGMKQKLALSCTLIHDPEVLFLDEPTTGVDPVSRREFWEILAQLKAAGTTIIVSTPYMDEAERCDRVGLIFNGSLIEEGAPHEFPDRFSKELLALRGAGVVKRTRRLSFPEIVGNVRTYGDRLHLTVDDAEAAQPVIRSFLDANDFKDVTVELILPSIEDVFVEKMVHG